jgi:hypothetical protein
MFVAKALSTGSLRKYQGSEQDVCVCVPVNIKWFDFSKWGCFQLLRFGLPSLSSPSPPIFPVTRRITRKAGYSTYLCMYICTYLCVCVCVCEYVYIYIYTYIYVRMYVRDDVVGILTLYGLEGSGIKIRQNQDFLPPSGRCPQHK